MLSAVLMNEAPEVRPSIDGKSIGRSVYKTVSDCF